MVGPCSCVAGSYLVTERLVEPAAEAAPQEGHADVTGDPALEKQPRFARETETAEHSA